MCCLHNKMERHLKKKKKRKKRLPSALSERDPTKPKPSYWFFPPIKTPVSVAFLKSTIQDFSWKKCRNENVCVWEGWWGGGGGGALNPCRPFIVSASGRRAYNIRHTFFNWAFSRRAHHLAEHRPRVKQSSLLSNVLAGSHLKCVSNCEICTRRRRSRRRRTESSDLYHFESKCWFCACLACTARWRVTPVDDMRSPGAHTHTRVALLKSSIRSESAACSWLFWDSLMVLLTHDNGDEGDCSSRWLGHSSGPAVTNDSSNPHPWSTDASWEPGSTKR